MNKSGRSTCRVEGMMLPVAAAGRNPPLYSSQREAGRGDGKTGREPMADTLLEENHKSEG